MIASHAAAILVVTGVLTMGASIAVIAPAALCKVLFGTEPDDAALLVTRHWGLLVALVGGLLVYAAYHPDARVPVMIVCVIEKLALGAFFLGSPFRRRTVLAVVVGSDVVMALLYLWLLFGGGASAS